MAACPWKHLGRAIRIAAAKARHILLSIAFEELEAPLERLVVRDGTIRDPLTGRSTTYWESVWRAALQSSNQRNLDNQNLQRLMKLSATAAKRLDLQEKAAGMPQFIHDLDFPGMCHARVVRPPNYAARLVSVDIESIQQMPGVIKVVRDGSFLAVIAEREVPSHPGDGGAPGKRCVGWLTGFSPQQDIYDHLLSQPAQSFLVVDGTSTDDPIPPVSTPC